MIFRICLLAALAAAACAPTAYGQQKQSKAADAATCGACHEATAKVWSGSKHKTANGAGCTDCHGASQGHVKDGQNAVKPDRVARGDDITKLCLGCHTDGCPTSGQKEGCDACHLSHALVDPEAASAEMKKAK